MPGRRMVATTMRTSPGRKPPLTFHRQLGLMATRYLFGALALAALLGLTGTGYAAESPGCESAQKATSSRPSTATAQGKARDQAYAACVEKKIAVAAPPGRRKRGAGTVADKAAKPKQEMSIEAAVSGEEIHQELGFTHRLYRPEQPNGETLVLLHGSGGNEMTLLPLAQQIAPSATLLAVRGRVIQDGVTRWYRRVTPVRFDQKDIRAEADAFATFLEAAAEAYGLDLARTTFIGYSNGANLVAALSLLHPGLVQRAALLRSMPVLDKPPVADLAAADFLVVAGRDDRLYARYAPALEKMLRQARAHVTAHLIPAGHGLDDQDARLVGEWLAASTAVSMATK
jgi:phospholipase/carboxylesterase